MLWIGPIPAASSKDFCPMWHEAGDMADTRPAWGGYLPCASIDERIAGMQDWHGDGTLTVLQRRDDGWYVQRPDRLCARAVVIACDALRAGAAIPGGVLLQEQAQARHLLAAGEQVWRWAAKDARVWVTP